jgi:type III pantothenate kinase
MRVMDINLLAIAVGNSRLHVGTFVDSELKRVKHLALGQQGDWAALLKEMWSDFGDAAEAEIAGCCVVPDLLGPVSDAVRAATGEDVQWVGSDLPVPITVTTDEPQKTGVDRALVTAAAYEQLGKACVVVDAGTALTVNLCNNEGSLVGGAIAPGATAMLDAMSERGALLPSSVTFAVPDSAYGTDTVDAMRHGVTGALRGLVQSMAERWGEEMGTWPEVIATGGDAAALFDGWEIVHAISPELLIYGIALAYTNHQLKSGE